ncbi:substrate-binding domain-containing protein [Caballeronia sp. LZ025]|uniref:substrate-binding domain-containing protein n=1 Tax=Caballeronia TaxID=1827195 RepID=UPI001FD5C469|nr:MULTISPECIES: substrate-binding domain-containing protein [Caballeronia]MDR5734004.1 substrate-binding domain-containing protein [Caballeronia sp. LZ025]
MLVRRMKGVRVALSIALGAASLIFSMQADASKGLVAMSQSGMENEWRVVNTKDMEKSWKDTGYDFVWTNANWDPAKQLSDVQDLLARKPKVLIVEPVEYEPAAPVPGMAKKAGVPLIVADRAMPGQPGKDGWISLLTISYEDTGVRVGKDVVAQLTKKNGKPEGKLLHVTGNTGAAPVIEEQKGLDSVFAKNPGIKFVAKCDGRYSREGGRKCTEDFLQSFPKGSIDGIVFDSDDEMIGGLTAIKAANRDDLKGYLWGKDGTADGLKAILDGWASYTVQTPPTFGALAVKVFNDSQAGKPVPPVVYSDKKEFDAHTPEHRALIEQRLKELKAMGVGCC